MLKKLPTLHTAHHGRMFNPMPAKSRQPPRMMVGHRQYPRVLTVYWKSTTFSDMTFSRRKREMQPAIPMPKMYPKCTLPVCDSGGERGEHDEDENNTCGTGDRMGPHQKRICESSRHVPKKKH